MQHAQKAVEERIRKAGEASKAWYRKKVRGATLHPGDQVLVRQVGPQGKHKISDYWEEEVYMVTTQPNPSIPVFTVWQLNGKGRFRTLHRNMLLPVRSVPSPVSTAGSPVLWRVTHSQTKKHLVDHTHQELADRTSDTDQTDDAPHLPGVHPQSSMLPCRGDSSLDLDEDEAFVLLEESVCSVRSQCWEGRGYEVDSSNSDIRPASSPQWSISLPQRIAKRRIQPAWNADRSVECPLRLYLDDYLICCAHLVFICFVQCLCLMLECWSSMIWGMTTCTLWTFYLSHGLVWQDWSCFAATKLWCSVIVTSAYAQSCRWLALLMLYSGVNSEIRFPYCLLLFELVHSNLCRHRWL